MTYSDVLQLFRDSARAKISGSTDGGLFLREATDEVLVVESGSGGSVDAAVGPSLGALQAIIPDLVPLSRVTDYGPGYANPVAYLYERTSKALLVIHDSATAANVAGAVDLALTWIW